jgi:hypothetical protein
MKRGNFFKSLLAIVMAPAVVAKQTEPYYSSKHLKDCSLDIPMRDWALSKCGDSKRADRFIAWYRETLQYWLRELRRDPNFHRNPTKAAQLAQFEGQTFDNLWKLFNQGK